MNKNKEEIENNEVVKDNNLETNDTAEQVAEEIVDKKPTAEDLVALEKDKFLRLFAEFENYKKRTSKERIDLFKSANKDLMVAILPILDDLERGIVEVKKVNDKDVLRGMELISNKLKNILKLKGLESVNAKSGDTFDAEVHEAITQIPAPSKKMIGKIIDVVEVGYKLGDKIIRYPKVVVGQ